MRKKHNILLAILLSLTMTISIGSVGFTEEGNIVENKVEETLEKPIEVLDEEAEDTPEEFQEVNPEIVDETISQEAQEENIENPVKEEQTEDLLEEEDPVEDGPKDQLEENPEEVEENILEETEIENPEKTGLGNLTVSHILLKENGEESLGINTSEYSVGTVLSLESLSLGGQGYIYSGNSSDKITISEGGNSVTLYYTIREEKEDLETEEIEVIEKGNLLVTHVLVTKHREEEIAVSNIEDLDVGTMILKESLRLNDEDLVFLGNPLEEITIYEGRNEIILYYEPIIVYTDLTVNHILRDEYQEELGMTEVVQQLEVGTFAYSGDYIFYHENINFLESDVDELSLIEGLNVINLYYELAIDDEYISEDPDFSLGEEVNVDSPKIEKFGLGSLGPFEEIDLQDVKGLRLMNSESYADEVNNKIWPEAGSLKFSKTGEPIEGSGNKWEITLEIEGKDNVETSDIVLVLDRSGSMGGTKITDAKNAAKSFVNTLLNDPDKTHVRIALVSFAGDVSLDSEFKGHQEKDSLLLAIDGIYASGGTHIQAGLKQANSLLNGSQADYKNIVLLGDGAATYSFQLKNPNNHLEHWYDSGSGSWWFDPIIKHYRTTKNVLENDFNYTTTVGNGNGEYYHYGSNWKDKYYYRLGASAMAEAGFGKSAGNEIYAIALDAGEEGEWTLEGLASPENYYETPSSSNLDIIFEEIAGRITSASSGAVVIDPIGDMYSIYGINPSNYKDLISVSHGIINYDTNKQTITWEIGDVDQGENYWMKYTLALDYSAEGGVLYPANKPTYMDYMNIDREIAKKYFPIPKFRLRALNLSNIVTNESGDEDFDIILEGPSGAYSKTWAVSLKDNESKTIKGLLPGSYTLKEIMPMNYEILSTSNLEIGEDDWLISSTIINTKNNHGWFYNENKLINTFKVGKLNNGDYSTKKTNIEYGKLDYFIIPLPVESDYRPNEKV